MKKQMDYSLFVAIIFLLTFGLIMLYSASYYEAQMKNLPSYYYLLRQFVFVVFGFVVMMIISKINHRIWSKLAFIGYLLSIILLIIVVSPLGHAEGGAQRWIRIAGGVSFQPVEFVKIAVIVYLANIISKMKRPIEKFSTLISIGLRLLPILLIVVFGTNNLSSAIIIFAIAIVMLFVASPKYMQFVLIVIVGIVSVGAVILYSFRTARIEAWLSPESSESGYQVIQALYAIGSGGIFGKGLGNSAQKLGFVPEVQNDMIFSIICEELGLFGAIGLILLFIFMIWRFSIIANNSQDVFGSFLVIGIMAHVAFQVILNIAVVTNSIPNTGVTLPFISSGGTAAVFLLIEMGLALAVSRGMVQNN